MSAMDENAGISKLQLLREDLAKIRVLEEELATSKWNDNDSSSPKAVAANNLLKNYEDARNLYMQRRLEEFVVDEISGLDERTNEIDLSHVPGLAASEDSDESEYQRNIDQEHAQALAKLETATEGVRAVLTNMRNTYQTIISRRKELEQMVKDMEETKANAGDDDATNEPMMIDSADAEAEREKLEALQYRKRQLQEEHARLVRKKEERIQSISQHREELAILKEEESNLMKSGKDPSEFRKKISELKAMKEFYDSLREVMEELGGVKILQAKEDDKSHHLFLKLALYEKHQVGVELEVYRKTMLKLVNAKWITTPAVTSLPIPLSDGENVEPFTLPVDSLEDLVQTAKTSMGPPHDLRFIIREACARLRNLQNRVDDIAILRRCFLTKVVGNDQVVCSLNEGIVIVMRLYDQWVKVEQIVGVSGWDQSTTDKIHEAVSKKEESWTPSKVVELVQAQVEQLKSQDGLPRTPKLPIRRPHKTK